MQIQIIAPNSTKTQRTVWVFTLLADTRYVCTGYREETRETPRHGWKSKVSWNKYDRQRGDNPNEPISIPVEIQDAVKSEVLNSLVVQSSSEYFKK